jgi:uncharacterized membrane protein
MTWIDWLGLSLFFLCWLGYDPLLKLLAHRSGSLNTDMLTVRHAWMTAMTHRELRLLDSQLLGHSINSGSFFASSNLLLIAGVAGILFGGDQALRGFAAVGAEEVPIKLLEAKLGLVLLCLARGLLDFIWSIRQMNYALALIGAAPEIHSEADKAAFGQATADVLNPALAAFSQGVRGYYFALAAASWLFGPGWLCVGVISAFALLVWRQSGSPAARAIRTARRLLEVERQRGA